MNRFVVNLFGQTSSGSKFQRDPFDVEFSGAIVVGVDDDVGVGAADVAVAVVGVVVGVAVVVVGGVAVSRLIRVDWNCFLS